jgi:hypothetical protein
VSIAYASATIDASIDDVWSVQGDFHRVDTWVGRIRSAEPESGAGPAGDAGYPDGGAGLPDGGAGLPDGGAGLPDGGAGLPDGGAGPAGAAGPAPVGSVRRLTMEPDGRVVRERLVAYDASGHRYSYEFAGDQPFPVRAYRGTVRLLPITQSGGTFIEWYGEFDSDADVLSRLTAAFTGIYAGFIDDLRKHLAGSAPWRAGSAP